MNSTSSYYNNIRFDVIELIKEFRYKTILEVGGGQFPTLLKLAEMHDAEGWGIDPVNNISIQNKKIKTFQGYFGDDLSDHLIPDDYYDLLIGADVLENIPDTKNFFTTSIRKLKKGGHLVLSVPNVRQLRVFFKIFVQGTFPRDQSGLFDETHLRWFCRNDVIRFAEECDLKLIKHRYIGRLVPPSMSSLQVFEFLALQNLFIFERQ